ncbi:hypothetical protein STAL104432_27240 [Streptomyces albus]
MRPLQTRGELVVFPARTRPGDLRHRGEPREHLVVDAPRTLRALGPHVGLDAQHPLPQRLPERLELVRVAQGRDVPQRHRLLLPRGLPAVEVELVLGAEHHVVAGLRRGGPAVGAPPGGDDGARGEPVVEGASFEDLVPADHAPSAVGEPAVEVADHPRLEGVLVAEPEGGDAGLGDGGGPPFVLGCLVAADVDVGGGEDVEDFFEDVFVEAQDVVGGGQQVRADSPVGPHAERGGVDGVGGAEFGVGGDGGLGVAGQLDLGDDGDVPFGGVGDDLAQVVLGVVAAVRAFVPQRRGTVPDAGAGPPGAGPGEARIAVDLDAPALVVGQVEVEDVELVGGEQVEDAQDTVLGQEVPGDVQHQAAPGVAGRVLDAAGGQLPDGPVDGAAEGGGRQPLAQGVGGVVESGGVTAGESDAFGRHLHAVGGGAQLLVEVQLDGVAGRAGPFVEGQSGGAAQQAGDAVGAGPGDESGVLVPDEGRSVAFRQFAGAGDESRPAGGGHVRSSFISPLRRARRPGGGVRRRKRRVRAGS